MDKLGQGTAGVSAIQVQVEDFIQRYQLFDDQSKCLTKQELADKIDAIKKEQDRWWRAIKAVTSKCV